LNEPDVRCSEAELQLTPLRANVGNGPEVALSEKLAKVLEGLKVTIRGSSENDCQWCFSEVATASTALTDL